MMRIKICPIPVLLTSLLLPAPSMQGKDDVADVRRQANQWRREHRTIDLHMHIDAKEERYQRAVKIMDAAGRRCGEFGLPVSIHVGDPKAFWLPYNEKNERWKELKDHRAWWFGDTNLYPPRLDIVEALDRVVGRHPKTTFVCVHFANNP